MTLPDRLYKVSGEPKSGSYRWPALVVVTGTNPAANVECSDSVPAGKAWLLRAYFVQCVQGITQTPLPSLLINDSAGNTIHTIAGASAAQNASVTCDYTFADDVSTGAGGAATVGGGPLPAPDVLIPEGYTLATSTAGKGANTNFGAPRITVYEYSVDG